MNDLYHVSGELYNLTHSYAVVFPFFGGLELLKAALLVVVAVMTRKRKARSWPLVDYKFMNDLYHVSGELYDLTHSYAVVFPFFGGLELLKAALLVVVAVMTRKRKARSWPLVDYIHKILLTLCTF